MTHRRIKEVGLVVFSLFTVITISNMIYKDPLATVAVFPEVFVILFLFIYLVIRIFASWCINSDPINSQFV